MPPKSQLSAATRRPAIYTFGFGDFHARTTGMTGAQRLAVFGELPEQLQRECWADLRERTDHRAELDFRDWCGDDR